MWKAVLALLFFIFEVASYQSFTENDYKDHIVDWTGLVEDLEPCVIEKEKEWTRIMSLDEVHKHFPALSNRMEPKINSLDCKTVRHRYLSQNIFNNTDYLLAKNYYIDMDLYYNETDLQNEQEESYYKGINTHHQLILFRGMRGAYFIKNVFSNISSSQEISQNANPIENIDGILHNSDLFPQNDLNTMQSIETHGESLNKNSIAYPIRIMAYNIWNLNDPWPLRNDLLAKQIISIDPVIIGFQEVRYRMERYGHDARSSHQVYDLSRKIIEYSPTKEGYQYVYHEAMTYLTLQNQRFSHVDEGLAIFSKFTIMDHSFLRLTRNFSDREDEHQRGCLRAQIDLSSIGNEKLGSRSLNFFTTHMSLSHSARRRNIMEIWQFAQNFSLPQIIVGDFNENPNTESLDFITGNLEIDGKKGNFKDAWKIIKLQESEGVFRSEPEEGDLDGWTYTTLSDSPKKRIDFILYRGEEKDLIMLKDIQVLSNEGLRTQPSDHRALYADFVV